MPDAVILYHILIANADNELLRPIWKVNVDRRKKLLNFHEDVSMRRLTAVAGRYDAQVFVKPRIADVLDVNGSGLDDDHFSYALRAHLDFVVTDSDSLPLFAVEFDGPHHQSERTAITNDRKKNTICKRLGLPLARVTREHVFAEARGMDYLTWLSELFFAYRWLEEAQANGNIPLDEPIDPFMIVGPKGNFPLFLSAAVRLKIQRKCEEGIFQSPVPLEFGGISDDGMYGCLALVPLINRQFVVSQSSIYLDGFGVSGSEIAEEIGIGNLSTIIEPLSQSMIIDSRTLRNMLVDFLGSFHTSYYSGVSCDLGFSLKHKTRNGRSVWEVGPSG